MTLTHEQIQYIDANLKFYGIASDELRNDLLDHICTYIEENDFPDFETAYKEALQKLGGYPGVSNIQRETYLQVTVSNKMRLKKTFYFLCVACAMLFGVGMFFKIFHWRGAGVFIGCGFILGLFVVMPLYFYQRYRNAENKLYNQP